MRDSKAHQRLMGLALSVSLSLHLQRSWLLQRDSCVWQRHHPKVSFHLPFFAWLLASTGTSAPLPQPDACGNSDHALASAGSRAFTPPAATLALSLPVNVAALVALTVSVSQPSSAEGCGRTSCCHLRHSTRSKCSRRPAHRPSSSAALHCPASSPPLLHWSSPPSSHPLLREPDACHGCVVRQ